MPDIPRISFYKAVYFRLRLTKQITTSPLPPTGRLWDHPPLRGRSRRSAPPHKTNPPNPPPVGKAGFDVWVLTKGGLVCLATCRPVCTVGSHHPVVHAHLLGRYAEPARVRVCRKVFFCLTGPYLTGRATIGRLELPPGEGRFSEGLLVRPVTGP